MGFEIEQNRLWRMGPHVELRLFGVELRFQRRGLLSLCLDALLESRGLCARERRYEQQDHEDGENSVTLKGHWRRLSFTKTEPAIDLA